MRVMMTSLGYDNGDPPANQCMCATTDGCDDDENVPYNPAYTQTMQTSTSCARHYNVKFRLSWSGLEDMDDEEENEDVEEE